MPEIAVTETWRVTIIESERGWGQRVDEIKIFDGPNAKEDADKFVNEFNAKNTSKTVPDWYMYAEIPYRVT